MLRGAAAENRTPDIDEVVKAHAEVYSVLVDYTGTGRREMPELITKWLEKMNKMSMRKSAVGHQTAAAAASGHRTELGAASGSQVVPERGGEVEKKAKIVAKPQGKAKRAEDDARKEDKRIAAEEQATKEATVRREKEAAARQEKEARMIRSKPQGGGEEDAEEEDVEMSETPARPESSKRKKHVDSSESDNIEVEGEEDDVEMDEEIDADAVGDAQSGGPNRPPPEMTTKINNPPCVRCKRLTITCYVKKTRVGDTKKWPACFPCAGKKQRCDWDDESEPAPGPAKKKLTQKPTQKPTPTSSRPTRMTKKTKAKLEEPPRKRIKSKVLISDNDDVASRPAAVIRVGKPIPQTATLTPRADPDAASDAESSIPCFSAMEKGKGRFRGESIYCHN